VFEIGVAVIVVVPATADVKVIVCVPLTVPFVVLLSDHEPDVTVPRTVVESSDVASTEPTPVTATVVTVAGSVLATSEDSTTVRGTVTSGSWSDSSTTNGTVKGTQTITLTSAVAGTTTITATPISNTTGAPGTAVTKTVTWVAATSTGTYDHSTAFISKGDLTSGRWYADSATADLTYGSAISLTPKATINVTQFNAADTTTVSTLTSTSTKAVVATITGAGAIGSINDGSNAGASVTIPLRPSENT